MSITIPAIHVSKRPGEKFVAEYYAGIPGTSKRIELAYRFEGDTQIEAATKALIFWSELKFHTERSHIEYTPPLADEAVVRAESSPTGIGRGKIFAGKIWVKNTKTKERFRVTQEAFDNDYSKRGFTLGKKF